MAEAVAGTTEVRSQFRMPLQVSERKLLLGLLDVLMLTGGLLLVLWWRLKAPFAFQTIISHPLWFVIPIILWFPLASVFDAYDLRIAACLRNSARCSAKAGVLALGTYLLVPYLTPPLLQSRLTLGVSILVPLALLVTGRAVYAVALSQPSFRRRTLIVGAGWAGRTIAEVLLSAGDGLHELIGFVDDDPAKQGLTFHVPRSNVQRSSVRRANVQTLNVLGDRHALPELVAQHKASTLILAITHEASGELLQVLMDCLELGVDITPMPVLYEELTGRVPVEHIGDSWHVAMPINHPGAGGLYPLAKRLIDVVLASIGLFLLALATPFIALAIYLESPGPIFYTQERIGRGGRRFRVYKFRSMVVDAEKGNAVWAQEDDPRATRVGRILRKAHVDEFPQFLNILRGEMSAVGPRPERPEFVEELTREIPFYRVRHAVKPGMAGWGLVKQGYGASKEDAIVKLQYDLYYIKHQSVWLDTVILLKTIVDTLTFRGRA